MALLILQLPQELPPEQPRTQQRWAIDRQARQRRHPQTDQIGRLSDCQPSG